MDLFDELARLVSGLNAGGVEFALCGGLAMAVYSFPRATQDIDLLVREGDVEKAARVAREAGYDIQVGWMEFQRGRCRIFRLTKIDDAHGDVIPLDIIAVTADMQEIWASRRRIDLPSGPVWVVSRSGLIAMKKLRSSKQDLADIDKLESGESGDA